MAIDPLVALGSGLCWLGTALIFRISSLSALVAAIAAPIVAGFLTNSMIASILAMMTVLIYVRHKDNIKRLIAGTEPRIGAKKD